MRAHALAVALLAGTTACAPPALSADRPTPRHAVARAAGDELVLAIGRSLAIPNTRLVVTLEAVVDDSRCPTGVQCVWAGDAAVRIRIDGSDAAPATYTLHTNAALGQEISHAGVRVGLVTVAPQPTADKKPQPDEYRVTLSVQSK